MTDSLAQFLVEIDRADREINLAKAALYVAQIEDPDLDLDRYLGLLDTMATEVAQKLPKTRSVFPSPSKSAASMVSHLPVLVPGRK